MKYGLIGEKLGHSYSCDIHSRLGNGDYVLREVAREDTDSFFRKADFLGINVTIPYKETVIPYLSYIAPEAEEIGAVNTVVKKGGRLFGYNTDVYGMEALITRADIDLRGRKVAVLGTGGTSKTAAYVSKRLGAREVIRVSRTEKEDAVSYEELYARHGDIEAVINTTPVGMYPNTDSSPIELSHFPYLIGVIDAIYNPLRTRLLLEAEGLGIPAVGGLYMLVAQGVRASEIFFGKTYPDAKTEKIYRELARKKENIVLIGMPASGKSTVGKALADTLGLDFADTDEMIREGAAMDIPEIFSRLGEAAFRDMESEAVKRAASMSGTVIATGGGAVLRSENVLTLKENGRLFFLDRSPELLIPTTDRPLAKDAEAISKRYAERYPLYCRAADIKIPADGTVDEVARLIMEKTDK